MNVLLLGPEHRAISKMIESLGDSVRRTEEKIRADMNLVTESDFIVSYGYQIIIKEPLLELFPGRVINLHISLLPWNRGSDPNLWSFLNDTPKGVTIHRIEKGVDTGDILAQREVVFDNNETLKTSYDKLTSNIEKLFAEVWPEIRAGNRETMLQPEGGSYHRSKDKLKFAHLLHSEWDTPVSELIGKANKETQLCPIR